MSSSPFSQSSPMVAPCIIDQGVIYQKQDIQRLLNDLGHVRYAHSLDEQVLSQGEGCIRDVFADERRSTMVANRSLYLNVCSFDYLELGTSSEGDSYFDLVQDGRRLRLVPLSSPFSHTTGSTLDTATLEVMMAEVLSANLDAQLDDDEHNAL